MRRLIVLSTCVIAVAIVMCGLRFLKSSTDGTSVESVKTKTQQASETSDNISYVVEESEYYKITRTGFMYSYIIYGKDKSIVKSSEQLSRQPQIEMVDNMVVRVSIQAGTGIATQSTYFYDVENGLFSEIFYAVFDYHNGMIIDASFDKVVVRSAFDNSFYQEFTDFSNPFSPVAFPFKNIVFDNNGQLIEITYLSGDDYIEVTESFAVRHETADGSVS